jgi:hypothetical protein
MPLDTMVTDMWDWDIHFEKLTFVDTYFDVAHWSKLVTDGGDAGGDS